MFVGGIGQQELCAGCLRRFAGLPHPQKHCVGERVWHVNEHVHGHVLKLETDLHCDQDQPKKVHSE